MTNTHIDRYRSDGRWAHLLAGIDQLTSEELERLKSALDTPDPEVLLDSANYDPQSGLWCALAVAIDVEGAALAEGLTATDNRSGRAALVEFGTSIHGDQFGPNPLSGVKGEAFTKDRLSDLRLAVRGLVMLRDHEPDAQQRDWTTVHGAAVLDLLQDERPSEASE